MAAYNVRVSNASGDRPTATTPASIIREALGARSWRLARYRSTVIYADLSWPVFLLLLVWTLASVPSALSGAAAGTWQRWAIACLTAALFFFSVLVQELAYLVLSRGLGEATQRLVLYPFGRASQAGEPPLNMAQEMAVALIGPAVAGIVGGLCLTARGAFGPGQGIGYQVLGDLGYATLLLAGFRLLPGLPLDGGRLLRLGWWRVGKDFRVAGHAASWAGETLAFVLVALGAYLLLRRDWVTGLWATTAGWLLRNAAVSSQRQIVLRSVMADISASRIMDQDFVSVRPEITVRQLVDQFMALHHQHGFPVLDGGRLVGLVTKSDLARLEPAAWERTKVGEIMTAAPDLVVISPDADGNQILERLAQRDLHQLPVVQNGRLVGMVSRTNVLRYLKWQTDLGMHS